MSQSSKPTPIAIPNDLAAQIDEVSELTKLSKQDVMRLCMRIGLVDLKAAEHDFPGIVKRIADDKGVSFEVFAKAQNKPSFTSAEEQPLVKSRAWTAPLHANTVDSTRPFPPASSPTANANIVPLPPQHVAALNDETQSPPVTEERVETTYKTPRRKRSS